MAKRIKIAKRHHELPKPYYVHAMAVINAETPRGLVIAGTAWLDLLLRSALELFMCDEPNVLDALFENRGALQDFSARIKVAYAFGIIGSVAYDDLNIMRDIRNAFAHSVEAIDFARDDVAALCGQLWYPQKIGRPNKALPEKPRDLFIRGIEHLVDGLYSLERELANQARGSRNTPFIQIGLRRASSSPTLPKKQKLRPSRGRPENPTKR